MPPKKQRSGTTQNKEVKPSVKIVSPDKKENAELSITKHKEKDEEFVALCKTLQVNDSVCDQSWTFWKSAQKSIEGTPDKQLWMWGVCLYVTATDMDVASFTLTQVLKAVELNVMQFLTLVRKLDSNLDTISNRVHAVLTHLEKRYAVMLALYQRFEKTCPKIFSAESGKEKEMLRICWTTFLLAKGRALQMEDDLVIAFQLLLCVLEFLIKRCPVDALQQLYRSSISKAQSPPTRTSRRNQSKSRARPPEPELDLQLLDTICKENDCNPEEVKNVYQTSFSAFLESMDLSKSQELPQASELSRLYEEDYLRTREFDGRLFLDGDETLLTAKSYPSQMERTPKKNQLEEDVPLIPPQTPVRAAMSSIQQLRLDLTSTGDQPSANLVIYFKNCTVDPAEGVLRRVEMLGQMFVQRFCQAAGPRSAVIARQRFTLGVRQYYKVMESMLKSEEKRLSVQNFSNLLNDSTFHTSLLACALQVVMATYGGPVVQTGGGAAPQASGLAGESADTDLSFPWILVVFQLAAFDFYKVIESFIKAEPSLSKDIVKHLELCEHLIMERLAWRTGSLVFELLRQAQGEGSAQQPEAPAAFSLPLQHNHTAADLYLSPMRPGHRVLPPAEVPGTPTSQAAGPQTQTLQHPRSNSLSLFYKKLYRLGYTRLRMLCSCLLSSNPELEPFMWTLLQHTLQHEYELMKDRHLDQLIMSAMYAICKVKNVDLRFKTIVTAYKTIPNSNQETFKHVLITEGSDSRDPHHDSIIIFYNQVFMQKLKNVIMQYASARPPTLSPIPQIPRSPYRYPNSPLRVPGSSNVYISPLKNPRMSPGITMTPRSRMLVSIGESFGPSKGFQRINQMVNSSDSSFKRSLDHGLAPKPLKRLRFDMDGQDEADGSKAAGESTLIQKLAEMSSTRCRMQEQKMKEEADSGKD